MKRLTRILLFAALVTALLVCFAFAEGTKTEGWTTANDNCVVTRADDGKYTASYTETGLSGEYALLVVKGTEGNYTINAENIVYIDQATAAENKVEFKDFIPLAEPDCVVLLGGTFQDQGPKVLGTIISHGVSVKGTVVSDVSAVHAPTVTLYDTDLKEVQKATMTMNAFEFASVPEGTYYLVAEMPGHLSVCEQIVVGATEITGETLNVYSGDVDGSAAVDAPDLSGTLKDFNKTGGFNYAGSDVDGDQRINAVDLGAVLKNYNRKATQLPKK